MNITGTITGIKYSPLFLEKLKEVDIKEFDINKVPATCLLKSKNSLFAVSKWVSPKRTRSYPFERVYNSLGMSKKITVIPIVKDEGANGTVTGNNVSYNPETNTLTLDGATISSSGDYGAIATHIDGLKIDVIGTNTITTTTNQEGIRFYGTSSNNIEGSGSFTINAPNYEAIRSSDTLVIKLHHCRHRLSLRY